MKHKNLWMTSMLLVSFAGCAAKKVVTTETIIGTVPPEETPENEAPEKMEAPKALNWNYTDAGPATWSSIDADYVMCNKGLEQSPVDLKWSKPLASREISFFYIPGVFQIESYAQKLQLTFAKGNYAVIDGKKWKLVAMQLHTPAEHTFSKKKFPLEIDLIHYNEEQTRLGVIAVVFQVGKPNPGFETFLKHIPAKKPDRVLVEDNPLNPSLFLPLANTHYAYNGSMTTPPCTEGVAWTVLNTPVEISAEQLETIKKNLDPNSRPAQPWNHRKPINYK